MPIWNRAVMPAERWSDRCAGRCAGRWAGQLAQRWLRAAAGLLVGSSLAVGAVCAEEEAEPGMELLEYLGMWEETDEEWLMFDQPGAEEAGDAADSEAEAPEPLETEDER